MVSSISSWASNIVVAVVITTIIEMILPDSNNKKYVKTVIGVFILFTIISPVITIISNNNFSLNDFIKNISVSEFETKEVSVNTNSDIEKVYIDSLKVDLAKKVEEKGYIAKEININVETKKEDEYGKIKSISFRMKKKEQNEKNNKEIVNIVSIEIMKDKEESKKEDDYIEMRDYIASIYEIDKEIVNVY